MLQTQNLVKIYKPKKGVPVKALDNVTLTFPETGMVFLLGKSGSGKSTLLNILGGLDRYNSGDILVKGNSTKTWKQSHFDSYRNTYVGFIFQEYNILDEFSVGTNIALALQLQGIKPSSEQVNDILREVDLDGYGNRNPNELSGGQKQRVAIARALVKNPKIIMADEPTGALDSATGRQVLTTLKKLSCDKLVIVVSHDREFAEQYADRIIELADGRVIRDVERLECEDLGENNVPVYEEDSVSLPEEYVLTAADKVAICEYIQNMISAGKQPKFSLFSSRSSVFQPTDESRIPLSYEGYNLIKSKLPLKYAFKLGASGLKHKKFRLVMTILLSCIALVFFGLTDTMTSYDYVQTAHSSLMDPGNHIPYASFKKSIEDEEAFYYSANHGMTEDDLKRIEAQTGLDVYPVHDTFFHFDSNLGKADYNYNYYMSYFSGCIEITDKLLSDMGAKLIAGHLPEQKNEAVVSTHMLEIFQEYGYREQPHNTDTPPIEIKSPTDMLGRTLTGIDFTVTICGIVDTGIDFDRYHELKDFETEDFADMVAFLALQSELDYVRSYSLDGMLMVNSDFIESNADRWHLEAIGRSSLLRWETTGYEEYLYSCIQPIGDIDLSKVVWLDGKKRDSLAGDEIILSKEMYLLYLQSMAGEIPEDYNFDLLKEAGNGFGSLANEELTLVFEDSDYYKYEYGEDFPTGTHNLKLVGIVDDDSGTAYCVLPENYAKIPNASSILQTLSPMPTKSQDVLRLVEFSDKDFDPRDNATEVYDMMNPVTFELKNLDEIFEVLKDVFFWIGLVFVVFASLLFSNFIAISVSYKKEQIGILRAIGSRGNDVFRIFFAESFIIAMINFVLSFVATLLVCSMVNTAFKGNTGMLLTILTVTVRQALLILGVCLLSAFVACWLPVHKIAAKRPIDAIRDR